MKHRRRNVATLSITSKINTLAATIISARSISPTFKAICALVLVILFAAGIVANTDATSNNFHVVARFSNSSFEATIAIADNDIWVVGGSNPNTNTEQPLAVHFNGTSWSVVPTPTLTASPSQFSGVAAVATNDVWAVGTQTISGTSNTLIEHWDGTSWSVVPSPNPSGGGSLLAVTAISSTDVWAVGIQNQISGDVVEHWDGTSWTLVSSPAFTGSDILSGISADASNDVWVVGDSFSMGGAVILHFDGTNWSRVAAPAVDRSLLAATVLSPTNVWAAGGAVGPPPSDTEAGIAHWNGTSWSAVRSPNPNPNGTSLLVGIAAVSAESIFAVGSAIEHWNGRSWRLINAPSGVADLNGVTALSDGTVVTVGQGANGSAVILQN